MNAGNMSAMAGQRAGVAGLQQQNMMQMGGSMNNIMLQIQQTVVKTLQQQQYPGWQGTVLPRKRAINILQLITSIRLNNNRNITLNDQIDFAIREETKTLQESPDLATYEKRCAQSLKDLKTARSENMQLNFRQLQAPQLNTGIQQLQGGMPNQMPGQFPQGFPNSQFPNFLPQSSMALHQHASQQQAQQSQMAGTFINPQSGMTQIRQQQVMPPQIAQNGRPVQLTAEENAQIVKLMHDIRAKCTPKEIEEIQRKILNLPAEQKRTLQERNIDPMGYYFRSQAQKQWAQQKQKIQAIAVQQQIANGQALTTNAAPQHIRPMSVNTPNPSQQFGAGAGSQMFETIYTGNMQQIGSQILGLQQDALRSQEEGQVVVPASDSQRMAQQQQQQQANKPLATPQQQSYNQMSTNRSISNNQQYILQQEKIRQAVLMQQPQTHNTTNSVNATGYPANLTGQVGGLNANINQLETYQSPAMPHLNRPVEMPNQAKQVSGSLQQQQQAALRHTQILSQAQNQPNQQQGLGPTSATTGAQALIRPPQTAQEYIKTLPTYVQQQLSLMPPDQQLATLRRIIHPRQQQPNPRTMQGTPVPIASPNHQFSQSALQNQQVGQHVSAQHPISQNAPNAPSNDNGGPEMQGQGLFQQPPFQVQPRSSLAGQDFALNERQFRGMDHFPFPPNVFNNERLMSHVPPDVKTWGALKAWTKHNQQRMPADLLPKLEQFQGMHFKSLVDRNRMQQDALNNQLTQSAPPGPQPGPAPLAPMVTSVSNKFPASNLNPGVMNVPNPVQLRVPSAQDIQNLRMKNPNAENVSDEEIRGWILRQQHKRLAQSTNTLQLQHQEAISKAQNSHMPPQIGGQQAFQINQPQTEKPHGRQNQVFSGNTMFAGGQGQIQVQQSRVPPRIPNQSQQNSKNLKRSNEDDVIEVPNPKFAQDQQRRSQTQSKQANNLQKSSTPQATSDIPVSTPQRYERTQAAQNDSSAPLLQVNGAHPVRLSDQGRPQTEEQQKEIQQVAVKVRQLREEVKLSMPLRQPEAMDQQTKLKITSILQRGVNMMQRMDTTSHVFYRWTKDENATKDLIRAHILLSRQFRDEQFNVVDHPTITLAELEACILRLTHCFTLIRSLQQNQNSQSMAQSPQSGFTNSATVPRNPQTQPADPPVRQMPKQHPGQRHGSRDTRAPAAPTTDKPPNFPFGPTSPPHGIPQYPADTPPLTQEKLTLPQNKKRKPNNQPSSSVTTPAQLQSTPASTSSPQINKIQSPQATKVDAYAPAIRCNASNCDSSRRFATTEELLSHIETSHTSEEPLIEDPLAWFLESARFGLGLDEDGKLKPTKKDPSATNIERTVNSQPMHASSSTGKVVMKLEGGTPMSRIATQGGQSSTPSLPITPQQGSAIRSPSSDVKVGTSKISQAGGGKAGAPVSKDTLTPPHESWADAAISPSELSTCFPTLADLQGSVGLNSLTPASTLSSNKSERNSPKVSDVGEQDGFDISSETDDWVPASFFTDSLFSEADTTFVDDDFLSMDWDTVVHTDSVPMPEKKGAMAGKTADTFAYGNSFDLGLFSIAD